MISLASSLSQPTDLDRLTHDGAMGTPRDQALAMAGAAQTPDEIERAMMALAALPSDAEVDAARSTLSRALDRAAGGVAGGPGHADGRMADMTLNPGFDNN
jgi:hypothetical protein